MLLQHKLPCGPVELQAMDWWLPARDLKAMAAHLAAAGLILEGIRSSNLRTRVVGSALGLETPPVSPGDENEPDSANPPLTLHRGTLRSGDHLESDGSVLLLGDVNPGARITAAGHVLVWGRLRGNAHAGHLGNSSAKIVALQLRPLQLRIATAVARGPEGTPPEGLAEQATLVDGEICLEPAEPRWPLPD